MLLVYDLSKHNRGKPKEDISMVTDYDTRYLKIISKIFTKNLPPQMWKGTKKGTSKGPADLLAHLEADGKIAVYWSAGVIVGAIVWEWDEDKGKGSILYICFKRHDQRFGYGRLLIDYAIYETTGFSGLGGEGLLYAETDPDDEAAGFFKKYGFVEITE
jgi:ribosomal protein S18 acetylase RimI-like enzyme